MSDQASEGGETIEFDYVEGGGPGIAELPAATAGEETAAAGPPEPQLLWSEEQISVFLRGAGEGAHMLAGVAERDWAMTEKDLERMVPPLTRICNRYEAVLQLAPVADPLLLAHGLVLYSGRSVLERKRAIRDAELARRQRDGYDVVDVDQAQDDDEEDLGGDEPQPRPSAPEDGASYFPESPRARSSST